MFSDLSIWILWTDLERSLEQVIFVRFSLLYWNNLLVCGFVDSSVVRFPTHLFPPYQWLEYQTQPTLPLYTCGNRNGFHSRLGNLDFSRPVALSRFYYSWLLSSIIIIIIIIIITRPKPAYGRQGLAGGSLRASGAQLGSEKWWFFLTHKHTHRHFIIIYISLTLYLPSQLFALV